MVASEIKAKANFWGYKSGNQDADTINFYHVQEIIAAKGKIVLLLILATKTGKEFCVVNAEKGIPKVYFKMPQLVQTILRKKSSCSLV